MLRIILHEKNMSLYQLEKSSHISHATLNDIYNEKSNIDHCAISTIYALANSLDISIEELYSRLKYDDLSIFTYNEEFDLFKSHTLQQLKRKDKDAFVADLLATNDIDYYFSQKDYTKALYLLSILDYIYETNNQMLESKYDSIRECKLKKIYISKSAYLLLLTKNINVTTLFKKSIKTFLSHNILEANIDDVI